MSYWSDDNVEMEFGDFPEWAFAFGIAEAGDSANLYDSGVSLSESETTVSINKSEG